MVDAAQEFVAAAVYNNTRAEAAILKKYREPAWNNPVVRFVDAAEKDLIPRMAGDYTARGLLTRMAQALEKAGRKAPAYLTAALGPPGPPAKAAEPDPLAADKPEYRFLPLTGPQAAQVAQAFRAGRNPDACLSPSQIALRDRLRQALSRKADILDGLQPERQLERLGAYAAQLDRRLGLAAAGPTQR